MTSPRKPRSDSATAKVIAFRKPRTFAVPEGVTLRDCDRPFWNAGLDARNDWQTHELVMLAHLARAMADHERLQNEIDVEGAVIDGKVNLKIAISDMAIKRALSLTRALQIHARATRGEARDTARRQPAPNILDDLIARPPESP